MTSTERAPAPPGATTGQRAGLVRELAFPVAMVVVGVVAIVSAARIAVPPSASVMGPQVFPFGVGALLAAVGAALAVSVLRGSRGEAEGGEDVDADVPTDWATVGKLAASFAALVVLVEPLGWPVAATVLFGGAAWSLGARPWWRPLLVGAVLAVAVQVAFTQGLDLFLPAGPLEGVPGFG